MPHEDVYTSRETYSHVDKWLKMFGILLASPVLIPYYLTKFSVKGAIKVGVLSLRGTQAMGDLYRKPITDAKAVIAAAEKAFQITGEAYIVARELKKRKENNDDEELKGICNLLSYNHTEAQWALTKATRNLHHLSRAVISKIINTNDSNANREADTEATNAINRAKEKLKVKEPEIIRRVKEEEEEKVAQELKIKREKHKEAVAKATAFLSAELQMIKEEKDR